MEDLLRGLAEPLLPTVSEDRLSPLKIPFGLGDDDKKEKVSLAQLAKFRGSTVDDLIKQMIGHWLERSNDNNLGDIKTLLAAIEIPLESIRPYDTRLTRHSPDRSDETSPPRRSSGRSQ
jgi:hypothetical protein